MGVGGDDERAGCQEATTHRSSSSSSSPAEPSPRTVLLSFGSVSVRLTTDPGLFTAARDALQNRDGAT